MEEDDHSSGKDVFTEAGIGSLPEPRTGSL